jgi:hypothetical protein
LILVDLRVWLLISYNVSRNLEGWEALAVIRPEEETDDPESKGARLHWIASYRGNHSGRDLNQHLSIRNHCSGGLPACRNLICGGGDGITINTGNVRLALEGHTITAGVGANRAIVASTEFGVLQNVRILGPGLITNGGANTFSVLGTSAISR